MPNAQPSPSSNRTPDWTPPHALRPIRALPGGDAVEVIDQRSLPHLMRMARLASVEDVYTAIREMWVRGAPLIGAAAAFGVALQARADASDAALQVATQRLQSSRPTAVNLAWALQRMQGALQALPVAARAAAAWAEAQAIADEDMQANAAIGRHGLPLLQAVAARKPGPVNVLTHCNAGWLATVGWGTATSPIYQAHAAGLPLHVWVDETRPRNQGASLTAWELGRAGVPHTVVSDNAGGHLMQHGRVDIVIVGCDRVTARGDVCNKIGTYLKALAAHDNRVPFFVAMPTSTLDMALGDGLAEIPIEERSGREVTHLAGRTADGEVVEVQVTPDGSPAGNPAFDVTPARLVTGLITEHGVVPAQEAALRALVERAAALRAPGGRRSE
jgi:methylthioribose-1-phosphate isomerase